MKKKLSIILSVIFITGLLVGCGSRSSSMYNAGMGVASDGISTNGTSYYGGITNGNGMYQETTSTTVSPEYPSDETDADINDFVDAKKVYSADITLQTKDIDEAIKSIYERIDETGSYIEDENRENWNSYETYYRNRYANITIRIPSANFDSFLTDIESENIIVTGLSRSIKDYTTAYYDKESRISSLRIQEERLLELLSNANDVEVMLRIEDSLADIRYEVESLTKEIRTIDSMVEYSTIYLYIEEVGRYTQTQAPKTFPERIALAFSDAMENFKEDFEDLIVGLVYGFPYILTFITIIIAAVIIIVVIVKKRKAKKIKPVVSNPVEKTKEPNNESEKDNK